MRDYLEYDLIKEKYCECEKIFDYSNENSMLTYIITTFNRFDLLKRCVSSIINQNNLKQISILISDNNTCTINDYYTNPSKYEWFKDKPVVYYVNKRNIGGGANCNQAVLMAKTKYICVLHDDDIIHPMHFCYVSKLLELNMNVNYVSFGLEKIDFKKNNDALFLSKNVLENKLKKIEIKRLYSNYYCPMLGALISRKAFLSVGGIGCLSNMEDYVFTYKIIEKYGGFIWDLKLYGYTIFENDSLNDEIWNDIIVEKFFLRKYIKEKNKFKSMFNCFYLYRDISYSESNKNIKKMNLNKKYISKKTKTDYAILLFFVLLLKIVLKFKG